MKQNYKNVIIAILVFVITLLLCIMFFSKTVNEQENGVVWNGVRSNQQPNNTEYIAIQGIESFNFVAEQLEQQVNICNPEENNCAMDIALLTDDKEILWETQNLLPGKGFYEITLNRPMKEGNYIVVLSIQCYSLDRTMEVNGCNIACDIHVVSNNEQKK